jgi:hypothetical protein
MNLFSLAGLIRSAAVLCVVLPAVSQAQQRLSDSYVQGLRNAEAAVTTLPAGAWDASRGPEKAAVVRPFGAALQQLGTFRAFAGDTSGAIAAFDALGRERARRTLNEAEAFIVDDASVEDAVQAIVAQARTRRVVLINEGHNMPMHRAFSQRVARELRKIGYTYLACETFGSNSPQAFAGGYVTKHGGFYTRDPVFGAWITEAMADGWKLVAYESARADPSSSPEQRFAYREEQQASNLVERIFAQDKDAKVLIHVGYSHLNKSVATATSADPVFMGEHLRRKTGLDMLHVDQTEFYAHPDAADESPLYARMLAKPGTAAPFVLKAKDGQYAVLHGLKGRVDMQVVFPRYAFSDRNGRPEWLASLAGRQPRDIPATLLPATGRRAVLAYRSADPADAVPADVVLVEAGKPVPKLMLPPGEYRFSVEE